jgi:hypothetical protein
VLGLALGNAYIDQFSNVKKSSIVGMSWEYHQKCKMFFETDILLKLFEVALTKIQSDQLNIQSELMALFEKILNWEFANDLLPGTFAKTDDLDDEFDKEDGPSSVKKTYSVFPKTWRSVIGNPQVVYMFFMVREEI